MVQENVKVAADAKEGDFTEEDFALIKRIVEHINANMKVGCTGCRYCMPCPKNVDIPGIFAAYNLRESDGKFEGLKAYFMCTGVRKDYTGAGNCIGCGKCEQHCPQHINIREELKNAKKAFEGPVYKVGSKVIKLVMKY